MERTIFLNIFLLITTAFASAQVSPSIRYTINDGLPSNNTRAIFKDSRDILWIGTDAGLCTYDGRTFTRYPLPDDLPSQKVWAIEEDPDGNLWFGTFGGGLLKYDGREFTRYTTPEITSNEIRILKYSERFDCLLVGTQFGFTQIKDDSIFTFIHQKPRVDNRFLVMSFIEDKDGIIFHTFSDDAWHFNPLTKEVKPLPGQSRLNINSSSATYVSLSGDTLIGLGKYGLRIIGKEGIRNFDHLGQVFGIQEDRNGLIWIAAWSFFDMPEPGGIYTWDGTQLRYANPDWGIEGRLMWNFFYDEATQTMFITSEGHGLFKLINRGISYYPKAMFGTEQLEIYDIKEHKENLWITAFDRVIYGQEETGFKVLTQNDFKRFDYYSEKHRSANLRDSVGRFLAIHIDSEENLWIGANRSLFRLINDTPVFNRFSVGSRTSENFIIMKDGKLLSGSETNLRIMHDIFSSAGRRFLKDETTYPAYINDIAPRDDEFWFSSNVYGLYRFKNDDFRGYAKQHPEIPNNISTIAVDQQNHLIIGTFDGNLMILEGSDSLATKHEFNSETGIIGSEILWLLADSKNRLWAGTNMGINIIHLNELYQDGKVSIQFISESEGLYEFAVRRAIEDKNGIIWLGGQDNLVRIDPKKLLQPLTQPKKVELTGFTINFKPVLWDTIAETHPWRNVPKGRIELNHRQNNLTFSYTTDNLLNPDKVLYSYHLDGFARDASPPDNSGEATFTNLLPGHYTLRVDAINLHLNYHYEPLVIPFRILPPWWKTWYFYTTIALLILLAILLIMRYRGLQIKKTEQLKLENERHLNSIRIQAVQAQMNPHFVFNVLSSIQSFMLDNDMDSTLEYLNDFSALIRKTMENISEETILLSEEISYLKRYIKLENLRLDNTLTVKIQIDKEIENRELQLPPMIIQPFVENAIKHGLATQQGTRILYLGFHMADESLRITICDNGTGLKASSRIQPTGAYHQSRGIKNTTERIEYFSRKHNHHDHPTYGVTIKNREKNDKIEGVRVEIVLPVIEG